MSDAGGNLQYASARVQARHGRRLDESAWHRLEAASHLGQYLQAAGTSALGGWVASIDKAHDAHAIERTLRSAWREYVQAVARWHPQEWQAWVEWWSWLPLLPLIARLARAAGAPVWLLADPVCGPMALGSPTERAAALGATALAPLAAAVRGEVLVSVAWLQQADRLAPRADSESREWLRRLMRSLTAGAEEIVSESTATPLRLFRAAAGTAIASGCHLALLWRDVERLRGGLVVRRLFPAPEAA